MKKMIISVVLLCSPMASIALPNETRLAHELNDERVGVDSGETTQAYASQEDIKEQEAEDAFDAFIAEDEDIPSDMIEPAKPVSACEAYFKEIGVQILMKYFAFKIWLEHLMQSSNKTA